jgi:hypothetical protein
MTSPDQQLMVDTPSLDTTNPAQESDLSLTVTSLASKHNAASSTTPSHGINGPSCRLSLSPPSPAYLPDLEKCSSYCNGLDFSTKEDALASSPNRTLGDDGRRRTPSESEHLGQDTAHVARPQYLKRRLASAYFAYFLCGWGDGGISSHPNE